MVLVVGTDGDDTKIEIRLFRPLFDRGERLENRILDGAKQVESRPARKGKGFELVRIYFQA